MTATEELQTIHRMIMCIAEADHRPQPDDTVTIRGVRNILWLLHEAEKEQPC